MKKSKPKTLHGMAAIKAIESVEGELSPEQRYVALKEGYVDGEYKDHKGIPTRGVGQTGKFMYMSYKEAFSILEEECKRKFIPAYPLLTERMRCVIMSAFYRGDIQQSPKFRRLFNEHRYNEAAEEFLHHKEYLAKSTPKQIKQRIKEVADCIIEHTS
jgi:GH24 family phage-related lysozyme (muramidase)